MIYYGTNGTLTVNGVEIISSVRGLDELYVTYPEQQPLRGYVVVFNETLVGKWRYPRSCHPANIMAKKIRGYARRSRDTV
jgi:hypothetical protein